LTKNLSNNELIKGFRQNESATVLYVYKTCYKAVSYFVKKNYGTEEDARDVFQEALAEFFLLANTPDFELKFSFKTFIIGISKNIWLKTVKKEKQVTLLDIEPFKDCLESAQRQTIKMAIYDLLQYQIILNCFERLDKNCKKILQLHNNGYSYEDIHKIMNLETRGTARKRRFDCKSRLTNMILNELEKIRLFNDE